MSGKKRLPTLLAALMLFSLIFPLGFRGEPAKNHEISAISTEQESPISPLAAEGICLSAAQVAGETLTVDLLLPGLDWTGLSAVVLYDAGALELVSAQEGEGVAAARQAGYAFVFQGADPSSANGRCPIVAAVGSRECRMSGFSAVAARMVFRLKNPEQAQVSLQLAVASLVDSEGRPLASYTEFSPGEEPKVFGEYALRTWQPGDVNADGQVSVYDALLIQRHLAGLGTLNARQTAAAQVSGGNLSVYDALLIQRRLAGLLREFPVQ